MVKLTTQNLIEIKGGGGGLSGALLNGFSRFFKMIHDIGRSLGSSVRRISNGNLCY